MPLRMSVGSEGSYWQVDGLILVQVLVRADGKSNFRKGRGLTA